jgi:protein TonB
MNYALSRPSASRRGSLLGIVVLVHAGLFLAIFTVTTVVPKIVEIPMVVELLQPPAEQKPPEAKPLPVDKPQPVVRPKATPRPTTPVLEATTSAAPAAAAPVAAPADTKPSTPAEPAVSQARFDADYLKNPAPPYPPLSRRMGEEGKVILRVLVSPQGAAESVELKTSSGSARLDEAALNTVRHWRFIPAKRGDSPIQSWVLVPITFKLEQ